MTVLAIENLQVCYQDVEVINALQLSIEQGEIVALFGPSGCGKTTVLKSVAGLLEQAKGNITIAERQVLSESGSISVPTEKRKVGLIFQDYALFPHLTVAQNIAFGLSDKTKQEAEQIVAKMLQLIKLTEYADSYPSQLSGGQQQRIAIVRALACEPDILLFDEAFSNIDPQFRFELIADIRTLLKQQSIAALFVTHNQDEAFAFCDRIALMHQGKIAQLDNAETLFTKPKTRFVAEFLGQGLWLQAKVVSATELETSFGQVAYVGEQDLSDLSGQTVDLYLRPHQLSLVTNEQGKFKVEHERFIGDSYQAVITDNGQQISVTERRSFLDKQVDIIISESVTNVFFQS